VNVEKMQNTNTVEKSKSLKDEEFKPEDKKKKKVVTKKKLNQSSFLQNDNLIQENRINFKSIFTLTGEDLIIWALNTKLLKKPSYCKLCRRNTGRKIMMQLCANRNYLDGYIWKCRSKECGEIENIRKENKLFSNFSKIKLRILLIYIFSHFAFLFSPVNSRKILGLSLKTIRRLSDFLSSCLVKCQIEEDDKIGQFGGKERVIEMDESCFFKRKNNKGRIQSQVWGFGFVERNTGRLFVEVVPNRSAKTLVPIILQWISKDTKILLSDDGAHIDLYQLMVLIIILSNIKIILWIL